MAKGEKLRESSMEIAVKLYDSWVHERQKRPEFKIPTTEESYRKLGLENFRTQLAAPRRKHLDELKGTIDRMTTADIVALLVMMELPTLETSALLHKLNGQLKKDPAALYFSPTNQADNCGCGCGCNCAFMADLSWTEKVNAHMDAKPFSIDPFNEIGLDKKKRDTLLIKDFLHSYGVLSNTVTERVNQRYF